MATQLFTPFVHEDTRLRAHMRISVDDRGRFQKLPRDSTEEIAVFDSVSQSSYVVKRADCGLGCRCAAVIAHSEPVN